MMNKTIQEMNMSELGIALNLETLAMNEMKGGLMDDFHDYSSIFSSLEKISQMTARLSELSIASAMAVKK